MSFRSCYKVKVRHGQRIRPMFVAFTSTAAKSPQHFIANSRIASLEESIPKQKQSCQLNSFQKFSFCDQADTDVIRGAEAKPTTSFELFVKENFRRLERENPDFGTSEIMAKLSHNWKNLSRSDRDEWKQKQEKLFEEEIMVERDLSKENKALLQDNQESGMLQLREKPLSPFVVFVQESARQIKNESVIERTRKLGKIWKEMGEEEKEKYRELSEKYGSKPTVKPGSNN